MLSKLEALVESDSKQSVSKPQCIDILIELLKNENTHSIEPLRNQVMQILELVSKGQFL